jgi:hypothetical protein
VRLYAAVRESRGLLGRRLFVVVRVSREIICCCEGESRTYWSRVFIFFKRP